MPVVTRFALISGFALAGAAGSSFAADHRAAGVHAEHVHAKACGQGSEKRTGATDTSAAEHEKARESRFERQLRSRL